MIVVFIAFGIVFGAMAASVALMSGGSLLLALGYYSAVGTLAALVAIFAGLIIASLRKTREEWDEDQTPSGPVSA